MKLSKLYDRFKVAEQAQNDAAESVVRNVIANKPRVPRHLFLLAKKVNKAAEYWKARRALEKAIDAGKIAPRGLGKS